MALEDIEKLKEKVAKDSNSKLFVPLADEYRKKGMLDEAVSVLLKGLETQPSYMSARVSLGKIYLEKKMTSEAKSEFEKVISAIPDNLFAHKKLAEIYRDSGDKDRAVREYRAVLKLNSLDEDAMSSLNALQSANKTEEAAARAHVFEQTRHEEPQVAESAREVKEEAEILPAEEAPQAGSEDEFELFRKSIAERDSGNGVFAEEGIVSLEDTEEAEETIPETVIPEEEIEEVEKEASAYVDMFKEPESAPVAPSQPPPFPGTGQLKEVGPATGKVAEKPAPALKSAEVFISEGDYYGAMKAYRDLLAASPGDKYVLQKIEELKMLLKMLGKEYNPVVDKLEAFGEGIKKRKDEFFGNT
ncbi:MAG: tetratricopeptide repeat protein [Nitrospirae bacterium]|nr:MAG: tetratricopeptide repeat protein [Nitrospirota bacterium]